MDPCSILSDPADIHPSIILMSWPRTSSMIESSVHILCKEERSTPINKVKEQMLHHSTINPFSRSILISGGQQVKRADKGKVSIWPREFHITCNPNRPLILSTAWDVKETYTKMFAIDILCSISRQSVSDAALLV